MCVRARVRRRVVVIMLLLLLLLLVRKPDNRCVAPASELAHGRSHCACVINEQPAARYYTRARAEFA